MSEEISTRFMQAIAQFDAANALDPKQESGQPAQLLYARRMTRWLDRLHPQASEPLKLAARSQHIQRWMIPRSDYLMTRQGYHQWRTALYSFHAGAAEKILRDVGYDAGTIAAVRSLLKKEKLKTNPDMQALEDVICLVFLEYEFPDFSAKHDREKVIGILRRTWAKMSSVGHAAALQLPMQAEALELIQAALNRRDDK
jgi:hypothetical protein